MDQEAPPERLQDGVDTCDVLEDLRSESNVAKVGDGIGGHGWLLGS